MTILGKSTSRTRRAAVVGLLVAVPLLPLAGCGEGGGSGEGGGGEGGGAEVEEGEGRDEEGDGGIY